MRIAERNPIFRCPPLRCLPLGPPDNFNFCSAGILEPLFGRHGLQTLDEDETHALPWSSFFLGFFVARNFLAFLSVFPFFCRDIRGSAERMKTRTAIYRSLSPGPKSPKKSPKSLPGEKSQKSVKKASKSHFFLTLFGAFWLLSRLFMDTSAREAQETFWGFRARRAMAVRFLKREKKTLPSWMVFRVVFLAFSPKKVRKRRSGDVINAVRSQR